MFKLTKKSLTVAKALPYLLIVAGIIGGAASFALTYDKIKILQAPSYVPSCDINPILSCGSVMKTQQASILGVPNSVYGLIAFSMLLTFGVLLAGGATVRRRVWSLAQLAATVGVIFMHYLFFQAVFRLHEICPWCFVVWMTTIPVFWYITQYNLHQRNLRLPARLLPVSVFMQKYSTDLVVLWYLIIFGILLERFWYYWSTLL
jgi:uncharacterized membrane protein